MGCINIKNAERIWKKNNSDKWPNLFLKNTETKATNLDTLVTSFNNTN